MEIGVYEEWMKPQIAKMFSLQYGVNEDVFIKLFENFYQHVFQKKTALSLFSS
jgi:hypothetical protein